MSSLRLCAVAPNPPPLKVSFPKYYHRHVYSSMQSTCILMLRSDVRGSLRVADLPAAAYVRDNSSRVKNVSPMLLHYSAYDESLRKLPKRHALVDVWTMPTLRTAEHTNRCSSTRIADETARVVVYWLVLLFIVHDAGCCFGTEP